MMTAIGLQNPRMDVFCENDIPFLKKYDTKIIYNPAAPTEIIDGIAQYMKKNHFETVADMVGIVK